MIYILFVLYIVYSVAREYHQPQVNNLGLSGNRLALQGALFLGSILLSLGWLISKHGQIRSEWPWLLLTWATAIAIYMLRPRPLRQSINQ